MYPLLCTLSYLSNYDNFYEVWLERTIEDVYFLKLTADTLDINVAL